MTNDPSSAQYCILKSEKKKKRISYTVRYEYYTSCYCKFK